MIPFSIADSLNGAMSLDVERLNSGVSQPFSQDRLTLMRGVSKTRCGSVFQRLPRSIACKGSLMRPATARTPMSRPSLSASAVMLILRLDSIHARPEQLAGLLRQRLSSIRTISSPSFARPIVMNGCVRPSSHATPRLTENPTRCSLATAKPAKHRNTADGQLDRIGYAPSLQLKTTIRERDRRAEPRNFLESSHQLTESAKQTRRNIVQKVSARPHQPRRRLKAKVVIFVLSAA